MQTVSPYNVERRIVRMLVRASGIYSRACRRRRNVATQTELRKGRTKRSRNTNRIILYIRPQNEYPFIMNIDATSNIYACRKTSNVLSSRRMTNHVHAMLCALPEHQLRKKWYLLNSRRKRKREHDTPYDCFMLRACRQSHHQKQRQTIKTWY